MHEQDFVAFAIAVVTVSEFGWSAKPDLDVVVPHEEPTTAHQASLSLEVGSVEEMVLMLVGQPLPLVDRNEATERHDPAWGLEVIKDGVVA
jgi:hypothetical protein